MEEVLPLVYIGEVDLIEVDRDSGGELSRYEWELLGGSEEEVLVPSNMCGEDLGERPRGDLAEQLTHVCEEHSPKLPAVFVLRHAALAVLLEDVGRCAVGEGSEGVYAHGLEWAGALVQWASDLGVDSLDEFWPSGSPLVKALLLHLASGSLLTVGELLEGVVLDSFLACERCHAFVRVDDVDWLGAGLEEGGLAGAGVSYEKETRVVIELDV